MRARTEGNKPSGLRRSIDALRGELAGLEQFRHQGESLIQLLDEVEVSKLSDDKARILGQITASGYALMMAGVAMQTAQQEVELQDASDEMLQVAVVAEETALEEVNGMLEGALPAYLQEFVSKIRGKKLSDVLQGVMRLLITLNASVLREYNPTLSLTRYATAFSLEKTLELAAICNNPEFVEKNKALLEFTNDISLELCQQIDQFSDGRTQLTNLAVLQNRIKEFLQNADEWKALPEDVALPDIAELLIGMIPFENTAVEIAQRNQAKLVEISAEFYEAIQFSKKPSPEQMAKLSEALPRLCQLITSVQNQQILTMAYEMAPAQFFNNFFTNIRDRGLQESVLTMIFNLEAVMPGVYDGLMDLANDYVQSSSDRPSALLLETVCAQHVLALHNRPEEEAEPSMSDLVRKGIQLMFLGGSSATESSNSAAAVTADRGDRAHSPQEARTTGL